MASSSAHLTLVGCLISHLQRMAAKGNAAAAFGHPGQCPEWAVSTDHRFAEIAGVTSGRCEPKSALGNQVAFRILVAADCSFRYAISSSIGWTWSTLLISENLGPENAIWDDGEWISWASINSELAKIELRARYPNADLSLIPIFEDLLSTAQDYHFTTGKHLQIYGDIGELFGAITYGIDLHRNYAKGSDGRLGNDFVEIKTITPFKKSDVVNVRLDRHFSKLLVVKIDENFEVSGRLVDRRRLPKTRRSVLCITWNKLDKIK